MADDPRRLVRSPFRTAELQEAYGLLADTQATSAHILTLDPHRFEAYEPLIQFLVQQGRQPRPTAEAHSDQERSAAA